MLNERQVTVNRKELIKKVEENRMKHIEEFEQAVEDYADATKRCIQDLHRMIKKDPTGFDHTDAFEDLQKPCDYTKDYDRILDILKMSVQDEVVVSFDQFQQWARDEWGWKSSFMSNSTTLAEYKVKGRRV